MKKSTPNFCMTPDDIKEGIRLCKEKVKLLLLSADAIVAQNDRYIGSGLYTYAVEELGKLLLLQKELLKTPNAKNQISVNPSIFGRGQGKHPTIKFDEFKNEPSIPIECKELRYVTGGVSTTHSFSVQSFSAIFGKISTDFLLRQNIFYVNWDNGAWVRYRDVEINDLKKAITELKNWMALKFP